MVRRCNTLTARFNPRQGISSGSFTVTLLLFLAAGPIYSQSNSITDSLYLLLRESKPKAALLNALASEYLNIFPKKAGELAEEALEAAMKEKNDLEEAGAWHNRACAMMSHGSYDTALVMLGNRKRYSAGHRTPKGCCALRTQEPTFTFFREDWMTLCDCTEIIWCQLRRKSSPR